MVNICCSSSLKTINTIVCKEQVTEMVPTTRCRDGSTEQGQWKSAVTDSLTLHSRKLSTSWSNQGVGGGGQIGNSLLKQKLRQKWGQLFYTPTTPALDEVGSLQKKGEDDNYSKGVFALYIKMKVRPVSMSGGMLINMHNQSQQANMNTPSENKCQTKLQSPWCELHQAGYSHLTLTWGGVGYSLALRLTQHRNVPLAT